MRILICSDGTDPADKPKKLGGLVAAPEKSPVTLLGIAEKPEDAEPLRAAIESEAQSLRALELEPEVLLREGEPIREILEQTKAVSYDLVVIGTRRRGIRGRHFRSDRTYEVIKAIPAPVMVAIGDCEQLQSFVVCTGGKHYIDDAVELTGNLAAGLGASVTLFHVMAEPPAIYADMLEREEDVETLLQSDSELGRNLRGQKERLEARGLTVHVRVRFGSVVDEVFDEVAEAGHDLIVTGTSQTRGPLEHYIMGDVTKRIVDRADCPVLVARAGAGHPKREGFFASIKNIFRSSSPASSGTPH